VNVALVSCVEPDGPESIVVSGGVVSIVQVRDAGVASRLPAVSFARTANVCVPSGSVYSAGVVQAANAAPFSEHSKVAASFAENAKLAEPVADRTGGPESIAVSGASIVHVHVAGVGSRVPRAVSRRDRQRVLAVVDADRVQRRARAQGREGCRSCRARRLPGRGCSCRRSSS
jgi:hypothetical protein